jgi:hypothetical protein
MRSTRALLVALALTGALAACSSGDDDSASTTTPPAPLGPTTTVVPDASASGTVTKYFDRIELAVTPDESTCLASYLSPGVLASLADAVETGSDVTQEARQALFSGLVGCEPASYVQAQVGLLVKNGGATEDQATCVVHATNDLLQADPALIALAASDQSTKDWPEDDKAKLRESMTPGCVPGEVADKIIAG